MCCFPLVELQQPCELINGVTAFRLDGVERQHRHLNLHDVPRDRITGVDQQVPITTGGGGVVQSGKAIFDPQDVSPFVIMEEGQYRRHRLRKPAHKRHAGQVRQSVVAPGVLLFRLDHGSLNPLQRGE